MNHEHLPAYAAITRAWSVVGAYQVIEFRRAGTTVANTAPTSGAISGTASLSFSAQVTVPGDAPPPRRLIWPRIIATWEPQLEVIHLKPRGSSASSRISGTAAVAFSATATLSFRGGLAGAAGLAFTGSATLNAGQGTVAGVSSLAFAGSGTLGGTGVGALAGVASLAFAALVDIGEGGVDAFLDAPSAPRCWLVEIDAFPLTALVGDTDAMTYSGAAYSELAHSEGDAGAAAGGVETLYFSDLGYTSHTTDSPASQWYDGRLTKGMRVERKIVGRDGIGGLSIVFAGAKLLNGDGGLDTMTLLRSLHGRDARIYVGHPDRAKSTFALVASVTVNRVWTDLGEVRLGFIDRSAKLQYMLNRNTYGGTGGISLEGGADLKGKYRPKAYGAAFNVMPPLVGSAALIYQVHDGQVQDVPAVYDRGIALTKGADYSSASDMIATAPSPGEYRVWKGGGFFRLGATPAGTVTADVEGDAAGGYVSTTSAIAQRILQNQAELTAAEIDSDSFAGLAIDAPAPVGVWVGVDGRTVAEVVEELLYGIGAFGGFSRLGAFTVARVAAASGSGVATFSEEDILKLERLPLPPSLDPIVWRSRVGWQRNYTLQTDLAAGVTEARRSFAAAGMRFEKVENYTLQSQHVMARELEVEGLFAEQADAAAEAVRLQALWSTPKSMFRALVAPKALTRDIGDVVALSHSRFGLSSGSLCLVLGHAIAGPHVELTLLVG